MTTKSFSKKEGESADSLEAARLRLLLSVVNEVFTAERLKDICSALTPLLTELGDFSFSSKEGREHIRNLLARLGQKKPQSLDKSSLVGLLSIFLLNKENFNRLLALDQGLLAKEWEKVIVEGFSEPEAPVAAEICSTMLEERRYFSFLDRLELKGLFAIFTGSIRAGYNDGGQFSKQLVLTLHPLLVQATTSFFPSVVPLLLPSEVEEAQLGESTKVQFFSGATQFEILLEIARWSCTTRPTPTQNGKVAGSELASIKRLFKPGEFFPNRKGQAAGRAASFTSTISLMASSFWWKDPYDNQTTFVKLIADRVLSLPAHWYVVPHLKNLSSASRFFESDYLASIRFALLTLRPGRWYDAQAFITSCFINRVLPILLNPSYSAHTSVAPKVSTGKEFGSPRDFRDIVNIPAFRGGIFFWAACGFLDLAYEDVIGPGGDEFAGLKALRITPLGEYILGRAKTFVPVPPRKKMAFAPSGYEIHLIEDDPRVRHLLSSIAMPLSSTRFLISRDSILRGLTSAKGLQDRKETLLRLAETAEEHLPNHWRLFFSGLASMARPFTVRHDVLVLQVSNDPKVQSFFLNDTFLRSYCTRAEGGQVIVAKKDYETVLARLGELGFLM